MPLCRTRPVSSELPGMAAAAARTCLHVKHAASLCRMALLSARRHPCLPLPFCVAVRGIRLVRDRQTGEMRGWGFVEFYRSVGWLASGGRSVEAA